MTLIPVILCGGAGSRLWPLSRELHPKPFIRMSDGESLLQKAFLRAVRLPGVAEVLTVTNRELFFKTDDEYREVNTEAVPLSYVLEPFGRNTAAAIASASMVIAERYGPEATALILPSDHLISDEAAFARAVSQATTLAAEGRIAIFGIQPDAPETGYGYIEADGCEVKRFVEKPDLATATQYLASGKFLWNAGMFCFRAKTMISELHAYAPEILAGAERCLREARRRESRGSLLIELTPAAFETVPDESVDYAVMEKTSRVAVVPCDIGWSDIGSWDSLSEVHPSDDNGNQIDCDVMLHDVNNTFIRGGERLVGAVGVDNLVIIDTPDALLVADRRRSQEVKHLYSKLKAQGHDAHRLHRTVHRPWGTYTVIEEGVNHKIKRIVVKPGASLSLQMHHHRSEHWVVVSGMAKVLNGEQEKLLRADQSTYIPAGNLHRLVNPGLLDLVLIEVQSGEYLGEDDIVRFDDQYGRTPA